MGALFASVGAYTGLGILAGAGVAHAGGLRAFQGLVAGQAVWPRWLVTPVAAAVTAVELTVGLAGLATSLAPGWAARTWLSPRAALAAATLLYVAFGLYGLLLLWRRPGAPCACGHADQPVNLWVPVRAAVLAAGCGFAAASGDGVLAWSATVDGLVVLLASAVFILLAWQLPAALHDPTHRPDRQPRDPQDLSWTSTPAP
jgi:hypothetical protein